VIDFLLKEQGVGTRIGIAAGVTDVPRGFQGLAVEGQIGGLDRLRIPSQAWMIRLTLTRNVEKCP
jgi:hypothetical protein